MKASHSRQYKRRQEGLTDYRKRLKLLASRKPRMVVRKSLKNIRVQLVDYTPTGDKVLTSAFSGELRKLGWSFSTSSMPAAYLTGLLCGARAKAIRKVDAVLDMGLYKPIHGSKIFAALKGALDAGMKIPHEESALPKKERIEGQHIADYASKLKPDDPAYKRQFSLCIKNKTSPADISKQVSIIKSKIVGGVK